MTEPNEPKKETTRIPVAPEVAEKPPEPNAKSRDTVRIQLPLREAPVHILTEPQPAVQEGGSPQFFQPPQPPPVPLNAAVMPAPDLPSSGLIKETVRIPLPTVQAKKNSTTCGRARSGTPGCFNCCGSRGEKSNAAVVAAAWRFRFNFDYSNLDLSFLKLWIIPL